MKKYLKVVEGSRGEVESLELVETSLELIKKELDKLVESLKQEGELPLDYIEEFTGCWEDKDSGLIMVGQGEEDGTTYVDYEMYKEQIEDILENEDDESLIYDFLDEVRGCNS